MGQSKPTNQKKDDREKRLQKGLALMKDTNYIDAGQIFTDLMKDYPTFFLAYELMAMCASELKNYDVALNFYNALCKADPKNAPRYKMRIGQIYADQLDYQTSIDVWKTIVHTYPDNADVYNNIALSYLYIGEMDKAREAAEKSLELEPKKIKLLYDYVQHFAKLKNESDPVFKTLLTHEKNIQKLDEVDCIRLYYTLFQAYNKIGEFETAFSYAQKGAKAKRTSLKSGEEGLGIYCPYITKYFSKPVIDAFAKKATELSPKPVFICSLPRSGTTLLEQLIMAHPDIEGIGEDNYLTSTINNRGLLPSANNVPYPTIQSPNRRPPYLLPNEIAQDYMQYLDKKRPNAKYVVEKGITTYAFLGQIHVAFPNAKFIYLKRDPVDMCISMYTHLFRAEAQPFTYDFEELAARYKIYTDTMQYWQTVVPQSILEMSYEDLLEDVDGHMSKVYDFIGVDYNDNYKNFHKLGAKAATASASQVRQPIYKSSVARWKRYGPAIKPLIEALGEYASEEAQEYLKS